MQKNKIVLEISDNNISLSMENPMNILDLMELTLQLQIQAMSQFIEQVPEEEREEVKKDLYNKYNEGASALLETFAPEYELRPDLTAEAILRAENEIIEEKYAALKGAE